MKQVQNRRVFVLVLTAISCEYEALRSLLKNVGPVFHDKGTIYEIGTLRTGSGHGLAVAIAQVGVGLSNSAREAERAISYFRPRVVFFVGVAGGLKDVKPYDCVVATKVYGYESGKDAATFEPRPDVGQSSYSLVQIAQYSARRKDWLRRAAPWVLDPDSPPRVFVGPIAAGDKVVASTQSATYKFLRRQYSDALAIEMEGTGFLGAAHANNPVLALIIRCISDMIDDKGVADDTGGQKRAAQIAATFAYELLINLSANVRKRIESGRGNGKAAKGEPETAKAGHPSKGTGPSGSREPTTGVGGLGPAPTLGGDSGPAAAWGGGSEHVPHPLSGDASASTSNNSHKGVAILAVMIIDIENSTQAVEALGHEDYYDRRDRVIEGATHFIHAKEYGGKRVKLTGDGLIAIFQKNCDAVRCALVIQSEARQKPILPFRIGIDCGTVDVHYHGDVPYEIDGRPVNKGERIQSFAKAGHILVSEWVWTDSKAHLAKDPIDWRCHGRFKLKGFKDPEAIYEYFFRDMSPLPTSVSSAGNESPYQGAWCGISTKGSASPEGRDATPCPLSCSKTRADGDVPFKNESDEDAKPDSASPVLHEHERSQQAINSIQAGMIGLRTAGLTTEQRIAGVLREASKLLPLLEQPNGNRELLRHCVNNLRDDVEALLPKTKLPFRRIIKHTLVKVVEMARKTLVLQPAGVPVGPGLQDESTAAEFFASAHNLALPAAFEALVSGDELQEAEGLHRILQEKPAAISDFFLVHRSDGRTAQAMQIFRKLLIRVYLHYGCAAFQEVCHILGQYDSEGRERLLQGIFKCNQGIISPSEAQNNLTASTEDDREVLAAFMTVAEIADVRAVGRSGLSLNRRWDIFISRTPRTRIIQELVKDTIKLTTPQLQLDKHDKEISDYVKALLLVMKDRLSLACSALELADAYDILRCFYDSPVLVEDVFFEVLSEFHDSLKMRVRSLDGTEQLESTMNQDFLDLCERERSPEARTGPLKLVPYPVQRKLARDGHPHLLTRLICCVRREVAFETLQHITKPPEANRYFVLPRINFEALKRLADNKRFMANPKNLEAFCNNPKAGFWPDLLNQNIPKLNDQQLLRLGRNTEACDHARKEARKTRASRGKKRV